MKGIKFLSAYALLIFNFLISDIFSNDGLMNITTEILCPTGQFYSSSTMRCECNEYVYVNKK